MARIHMFTHTYIKGSVVQLLLDLFVEGTSFEESAFEAEARLQFKQKLQESAFETEARLQFKQKLQECVEG